jgi:hypothetical protein
MGRDGPGVIGETGREGAAKLLRRILIASVVIGTIAILSGTVDAIRGNELGALALFAGGAASLLGTLVMFLMRGKIRGGK